MKLVDTHCHLAHRRLRGDVTSVLRRAGRAGLVGVICAAGNVEESQQGLDLSGTYDEVYFTAGVHPHDAAGVADTYLQSIERLTVASKCVAIGEIGLDYHYNFSPPQAQRRVFAEQLDLAGRLSKRVVVHTREALDDTLAILAEAKFDGSRTIFHSFTEGPEALRRVLDFGAAVGFSGIVTFSSARDLHESAKLVPDGRFLIETDSPYLSPEPVRKARTNEPANVVHIAAFLGGLRNTSLQRIAELTTATAGRLFWPSQNPDLVLD